MRQFRHILDTFAQAGHVNIDHVDTVEQVVAESPGLYFSGQVLVGGAQQAHIGSLLAAGSHRPDGFLLNRAQQLDLHRQRQVGDLVKKQRTPGRRLEQAYLVLVGAGKTAPGVTEQFTFHQLGRNGAAVDRNERAGSPRPVVVNEPGHHFLAAARLAVDMHRGLAARQLGYLAAQLPYGRTGPDQVLVDRVIGLAGVALQLQGAGDQFA